RLVAEVAERAEQVHGGVEALVGERELAIVALDELRPALAPAAPARLVEQRARAVDPGHAEAGAGQRQRMAPEAARHIEQLGPGGAAREPRRAERLRLGLLAARVLQERAQVEVAEERVPGLGRARRRHAAESRRAARPTAAANASGSVTPSVRIASTVASGA